MIPTISRRKWMAAWMVFLLIAGLAPAVNAAQDVTASAQMVCISMVKQGDTYYLSPGSEAHASYTLKNDSGQLLSLKEIKESIGSAEYTIALNGQFLNPGETVKITGTSFTAQSAGRYPIQARLTYDKLGGENTVQIADIKSEGVNISFEADYQLLHPDVLFAGETYTATYRAAITSHSNVKLNNVQAYHVPDAGNRSALGSPISLPAGEGGLWEKDVTASYQQDTGGYLAVQYTDPINGSTQVQEFTAKWVGIHLNAGEPDYSLTLSGQSDPPFLMGKGDVAIDLTALNDGNAPLADIVVKDWMGNTVMTADKLSPGQSDDTQMYYTLEPESEAVFTATATVEGTNKTVESQWNLKVPLGMDIRVERTLIPSIPTVGEPFTLRYALTNQGAGDLTDIVIDEVPLEKSVELTSLAVGETKTVDMALTIQEAASSQPTIIARDAASGEQMSMDVESMPIPVAMPAADTLLSVSLAVAPLDAESVSVTCTLRNTGQIELINLAARLTERNIILGSVLALAPGEEKVLTYDRLVKGDLLEITAQADAVLPNGDLITVMSDPLVFGEESAEPSVSPSPSPGVTPEPENQNRGRGILLPVLITVLVLGAAALAIIFWPKKKSAHAKPPKGKGGGGA